MKRSIVFWVIAIFGILSTLPAVGGQSKYTIFLKNGNQIQTSSYTEKKGKIYFEQFGAQVGISRSKIQRIVLNSANKKKDRQDYSVTNFGGRLDLPIPEYYQVSGAKNKGINGLYEQRGTYNNKPTYKQVGGRYSLFFHKAWALGEYGAHSKHVLFIHPTLNDLSDRRGKDGWTSSRGEYMYPEIRVVKVGPPKSIYQGHNVYVVEGFPAKEFNGIYKPERIENGRVRYSHENKPYVLHFSVDSWVISRCPGNCFQQYWTKKLEIVKMAHNIPHWYDAANNYVSGKVSIFTHKKVIKNSN